MEIIRNIGPALTILLLIALVVMILYFEISHFSEVDSSDRTHLYIVYATMLAGAIGYMVMHRMRMNNMMSIVFTGVIVASGTYMYYLQSQYDAGIKNISIAIGLGLVALSSLGFNFYRLRRNPPFRGSSNGGYPYTTNARGQYVRTSGDMTPKTGLRRSMSGSVRRSFPRSNMNTPRPYVPQHASAASVPPASLAVKSGGSFPNTFESFFTV